VRGFSVQKGVIGYIVSIGCQRAGFTNKEELKVAICNYIDDPEGMEKKYYTKIESCEPIMPHTDRSTSVDETIQRR
jgi:hypothetical protein